MEPGTLTEGDETSASPYAYIPNQKAPPQDTVVNGHSGSNGIAPEKEASQHKSVVNGDSTAYPSSTSLDALISRLSSEHTNPALTVAPEQTISMQPSPIATPSPTQALIHVRCTGICGSDMNLWHTGRIGPLVVDRQCILGHEASGTVLAVGHQVTHLRPGDNIAIEPGVPCETCWLCREGRYNLCERVKFSGVCPDDGSTRRFMVHEGRYCHKMPDGMSYSQGALLEPLAVVMHAIKECKGAVGLGRSVLVCGAGPIGLIAAKASRASGAWPVVVTDVDEGRLKFAKRVVDGVQTYQVNASMSEAENSDGIRKLFGCKGRDAEGGEMDEQEYMAPQCVLECTGVESSVITACYSARRGGMVMVVGVGRSKMDGLPFMHLSLAEIELRFINRYRDMWPAAINVLGEGKVLNLDDLVTHTYALEKAVEAMEACSDKTRGGVKVQIVDDTEIRI